MAKIAALTTKLMVGDGAGPEVFTALAYVTNISGPSLALDTEDVTTHDQATAFEEAVATILRTGDVTLDIVYDPDNATQNAGAAGILNDYENKTKRNFQIRFPSAGKVQWSFAAYVTGFSPSAPVGGALTASIGLKISGVPTLDGAYV